jgi:hypothetical protein
MSRSLTRRHYLTKLTSSARSSRYALARPRARSRCSLAQMIPPHQARDARVALTCLRARRPRSIGFASRGASQ